MCVTVGMGAWRDISKCTEGSWRGAFAVTTKEQLKLEILFVKENKCFEGIPSRPKCVCKFAHWFSSVFTSLQMHCRVFCNLVDSSNFKTNQEIMIFTGEKYTHVAIQVQPFRRKPKKLKGYLAAIMVKW